MTSKVERTRLRVGGHTRKQTVAHAFVQSPVTRRCTTMHILLACRKAIPSLTVAFTVARWSISMIYACTPTLYVGLVHSAFTRTVPTTLLPSSSSITKLVNKGRITNTWTRLSDLSVRIVVGVMPRCGLAVDITHA